ncbi:MAG TPA: STAS-like domain-containing protein [Leptospiraceae bacterium]|nr:STAS-like domain-containing protein [Leptospiraceae bacterium]HMW06829.1 STAS-like domain-containing protein [Leptospiraceae bacterium]HMX32154.1 STAS-like domain-containing protein [Leptospiraceae bacterium]HMY32224.1 STAS-like domain-containing protein [Leptospiraceae bacterium]HMZ67166.1 STAS-like domain-containing protein [Leptospiraceae bacterium]
MNTVDISVFSIVGSPICVDAEDGERVYELIHKTLKSNSKANISFLNVDMLTSAFLNTAIGKLYNDFSEDEIKKMVSITNISDVDKSLLKRVVKNAKLYYKDPTWMEKTLSEITGENP